jgi:hypothetical protein
MLYVPLIEQPYVVPARIVTGAACAAVLPKVALKVEATKAPTIIIVNCERRIKLILFLGL